MQQGIKSDFLDEREHFDCGPVDDNQFPNRWPDQRDLPGFRDFMERYYHQAQMVSLQIMRACEIGLELPEGLLVNKCIPAASELRLNRYPAVSIEKLQSRVKKRTWPHTDLGVVTLLFQDAVGGLELEDRRNGGFSPVIRDHPFEMVVNISDTLQRWTNDELRAGLHHVTTPVPMKQQEAGMLPERFSCIFFLKADRETSAGSLPTFVRSGKAAKYEDITAIELQHKGVKELYAPA
ncbi:uncharacterized protein KY384_007978 [Bacidia gigantensis]|uniref:uncharacterized protein n=1 Tax=Bacidia gigantensis TaxID=2732470 RepID=UPI001D041CFA|nr:uncharacterized protein KY384_007978 [Bacidia gigantensis]KAG8527824.1 hypothetical protein KY384_007978 [Bacidia gigantensis]